MGVHVYPLGFDWQATAGPSSLGNLPLPAADWGTADPNAALPRGTYQNFGTTGWTENASLDDPLVGAAADIYGVRSAWAILTGLPTALPAGTTKVELRITGQSTRNISGADEYALRNQIMVTRSDDVDFFAIMQHWGIQRRIWSSVDPSEGADVAPSPVGDFADPTDAFGHTVTLSHTGWGTFDLYFSVAMATTADFGIVQQASGSMVGSVVLIVTTSVDEPIEPSCETVVSVQTSSKGEGSQLYGPTTSASVPPFDVKWTATHYEPGVGSTFTVRLTATELTQLVSDLRLEAKSVELSALPSDTSDWLFSVIDPGDLTDESASASGLTITASDGYFDEIGPGDGWTDGWNFYGDPYVSAGWSVEITFTYTGTRRILLPRVSLATYAPSASAPDYTSSQAFFDTICPEEPVVIPPLEIDPGNIAPRYANAPAFQTRRRVYDGDFVRGPGGWKAFLRYGAQLPEGLETSLLVSQPVDYDKIKIWWGVPPEGLGTWTYMALVRSGFGHPLTPTDGEVLVGLDGNRPADEVPGTVIDSDLPQGKWFYYTLMFRVGTRWYPINRTQNVVPIDYRHRDVLFNETPPFYQEVDAERYAGTGSSMLGRWYSTVGYDLDLTRTLTEGIDLIYDPDRAPQRLLDPLGEQNLGFNTSDALGDIRYRAVVAKSQDILGSRGTYGGLKLFVESATQYSAYVSPGINLMALNDDARFAKGKGNWSPTHYGLNRKLAEWGDAVGNYTFDPADLPFTSRQLSFTPGPSGILPEGIQPYPAALSQAHYPVTTCTEVRAGSASREHLVVSCGAGQQFTVEARDILTSTRGPSSTLSPLQRESIERLPAGAQDLIEQSYSETKVFTREKVFRLTHLSPTYRGIPVDEGSSYYFSFWMCAPLDSVESYRVNFGMAYYPPTLPGVGFSDAFFIGLESYADIEPFAVDLVKGAPVNDDGWYRYVMSSEVPEGARFLVPVIWVTGTAGERVTTPRYLTAAMVNGSQGVAAGTLFRPDFYFRVTADDPNYLIGEASNKVLGEPAV